MGATRQMFPELAGDLSTIPVGDLQDIIVEIYSGTMSFGRLPEWVDWYHYCCRVSYIAMPSRLLVR